MLARFVIAVVALLCSASIADAQRGELRLDLNIPANRLVVYEGDRQIRSYPVSVGLPGHDTPVGSFSISHAEWNPWWRPPAREWAKNDKITPPGPNNPMGRVKLFFMPLYFIHGTPDKGNIGSPASHGCVRMLNSDVIALAKLLHERAAPQVTGAQIDRILASSSKTRQVNFQRKIPVVIRYEPVVVENGTVKVYPDFYRYNAVHSEAVYQALLKAGYDPQAADRARVNAFVNRAKGTKTAFTIKVEEAFGTEVAATLASDSVKSR